MKKIIILVLAINLLCSWTIIRVDRKENDANSATIFKVMMVVLGEKRTEEIFYDYYWNKLGENVDVPECLIKHYTVLSFKYSADFYNIKKFYWSTLQPVKISYKETEAIYNYIKKNDIVMWLSPLPFNADSTCVSAWLRRWSGTVYGTYEVYPFPSEQLTEANYKKYLDEHNLNEKEFSPFEYYKMIMREYSKIPLDSNMIKWGYMDGFPYEEGKVNDIYDFDAPKGSYPGLINEPEINEMSKDSI